MRLADFTTVTRARTIAGSDRRRGRRRRGGARAAAGVRAAAAGPAARRRRRRASSTDDARPRATTRWPCPSERIRRWPPSTSPGRPIEYVRRGTGEPLLLIQGMSGTHAGWGEPFLVAAGARPRPDRLRPPRDRAHRPAPRASFTIADLADDAAGVLDALGIERAHVLGISMGGMVAQELAIAPSRAPAHAHPRLHLPGRRPAPG